MKKEIRFKLKRELGLFEATLCGVGIILGAGIYALVGKAAGLGGNAVWISFLIASLIAVFTGLSYAELSSMFPKAGAEYVYIRKAFGKRLAFLIGWLIITGGVIAGATVALGFAGYFSALFNIPVVPVAIGLILVLSLIIFYGIKQSVWFAIVFTLIEAAGLLLIIFIGLPFIGSINYLEMPSLGGVFSAAALIFFAFIGFEEIVRLSEETKKPKKTIPKALVLAIAITTIIYIFVALSSVGVLSWEELGASNAPLADVASKALGVDAFIILSVIALFATANTVLLILLATSRIVYGMAKSYSLPNVLARVHPITRTPWIAIILLMVFSMLFVLVGDIELIANLTNFTVFITFIIINLSLIWLRYTQPKLRRPFKTPVNIGKFPVLALLGILSCVFLIINIGLEVLVYGFILLIISVLIYCVLNKYNEVKTK
jgi:APA family basic amino acid/polyamine antiporter